ncbi:MAG: hypothetical protein LQ350_002073 [Teloschistes chrysophthalmus]|nr:MAG: hypothetical protein LQ350_002073 [Niorma chrysophthalma]
MATFACIKFAHLSIKNSQLSETLIFKEQEAHNPLPAMETTGEAPQPDTSVTWSLEPTTHSFSKDPSPTIKLQLTNHDSRPITIYNEHLIPSVVLAEGHFIIFDYTSNKTVDQTKTRFCDFPPPSKVHVPLREHLFHTLHPGEPTVFTATFGRSKMPSQPK